MNAVTLDMGRGVLFGHRLDGQALVWDLWMHVLYDTLPVTGELRFYSYLSSYYFHVAAPIVYLLQNGRHISVQGSIDHIHGLFRRAPQYVFSQA